MAEETSNRMTNLSPEEIRRRIDEALSEIDEVEAQVLELFTDIGGADARQRLLDYMRATQAAKQGPLKPRPGPR